MEIEQNQCESVVQPHIITHNSSSATIMQHSDSNNNINSNINNNITTASVQVHNELQLGSNSANSAGVTKIKVILPENCNGTTTTIASSSISVAKQQLNHTSSVMNGASSTVANGVHSSNNNNHHDVHQHQHHNNGNINNNVEQLSGEYEMGNNIDSNNNNNNSNMEEEDNNTNNNVNYANAHVRVPALSKLKKPVRYRECLKNHAANLGGHATDGCGEFMPSGEDGTIEALICAACNCHRNFHRREIEGETHPITSQQMTMTGAKTTTTANGPTSLPSSSITTNTNGPTSLPPLTTPLVSPLPPPSCIDCRYHNISNIPSFKLDNLRTTKPTSRILDPHHPQYHHNHHHNHHHSSMFATPLPLPLPNSTLLNSHAHMMMAFNSPPPPTPMMMSTPGSGNATPGDSDEFDYGFVSHHSGSLSRKRFRTKFTQEQKDQMASFAQKLGWRIQKQDEEAVQQFCAEVGVKRHVLKVWMHNNKLTVGKKLSSPCCLTMAPENPSSSPEIN